MTERTLTEWEIRDIIRQEIDLAFNARAPIAHRYPVARIPGAVNNFGMMIATPNYGGSSFAFAVSDGEGNWQRFDPDGTL